MRMGKGIYSLSIANQGFNNSSMTQNLTINISNDKITLLLSLTQNVRDV